MGLKTADFVKTVPTTLGALFQFGIVPMDGFEVWLDNQSETNAITYRFQDSDDGVNWSDRQFYTTDPNSLATVFSLDPLKAQPITLTRKKNHTRLMASAPSGTLAALKVQWPYNDEIPTTLLRP